MTDENITKRDLAEKLLQKGNYNEAVILLEEIHRESPDEDPVLLMLSWAYYDSGKTDQAVKYLNMLFDRELQRKVFTGFAFDELVRIYRQTKDFSALVDICERANTAQPEDVGLLKELGNAYLQSGRVEKACAVYKRLVELENDNSFFYCSLGEALFAAGFYQESEKAYQKAGEIDPAELDQYYFKVASLFQQAQKYADAERLLNKCVTVKPSNPLYHCALGDCLIGLGHMKNALAAYEKAVQYDRSRAAMYFNRLGNSLLKAGNHSQAADAFQSAIKYESAGQYYLNLALAYRGMGLKEKADMIERDLKKISSRE